MSTANATRRWRSGSTPRVVLTLPVGWEVFEGLGTVAFTSPEVPGAELELRSSLLAGRELIEIGLERLTIEGGEMADVAERVVGDRLGLRIEGTADTGLMRVEVVEADGHALVLRLSAPDAAGLDALDRVAATLRVQRAARR